MERIESVTDVIKPDLHRNVRTAENTAYDSDNVVDNLN